MYFLQNPNGLNRKKLYVFPIIIFLIFSLTSNANVHNQKFREKANSDEFLTIENGQFMLNNEPFIMKGFNYFPRNYHKSSMVTWDWNEVDTELALGKILGSNVVRTFIDYGFSTDSLGKGDYNDGINDIWEVENYYKPTRQYISAINNFLDIAYKHELNVIFSLFDYMPGWAFIDQREQYIGLAKIYLDSLIGYFKDDSRIVAWDILNEGDLLTEKYGTPFPKILEFYKEMYNTIDSLDSNHAVTAVFGNIDSVYMSEDLVDFISFQFPDSDQAYYGQIIRKLKSTIQDKEKPIISAEFSHSTKYAKGASEREHTIRMANYYDHCLNVERSKLNGALFWTLTDFSEHPKTELTRLMIPVPIGERFEFFKGVLDTTLKEKTSFDVIKRYYTKRYNVEDRLDFQYSKIKKPSISDSLDKRHFAVTFHDKIEFLDKDSSVIDIISFSDTTMAKHLPGKGWYLLEDWSNYWGYWGQKAGNLDSVSSMYITPPDSTYFIKLRLEADSLNNKLTILMSGLPLDSINLTMNPLDYTIPFKMNNPPEQWDITGKISYYSNNNPVNEAIIKANNVLLDTTDSNGDYGLIDLLPDNYVIYPEKEYDTGSAISAYDASWILQYVVGLKNFTPYQLIAGDVSGDGTVSAFDASKILQYNVGLISQFPIMPDSTHFWRFVPENFPISQSNWITAPDSFAYIPLNRDTTDNYFGIIYGDVTGNWHPSARNLAKSIVATSTTNIRRGDIYGKSGERILLPVYVDNESDIVAMRFTLEYDPRVLKAVGASLTSFNEDFQIAYNVLNDRIRVALAGSQPISGSDAIVNLEFDVLEIESTDATSQLEITAIVINEGNICANVQQAKFSMGVPVPEEYALGQNYPNPFNPETTIKYQLPGAGKVVLKIYNIIGQEIRTLVNEEKEAGYHFVVWDAKDNPSGMYLIRFQSGEFIQIKKCLIIK